MKKDFILLVQDSLFVLLGMFLDKNVRKKFKNRLIVQKRIYKYFPSPYY